jgi:hypothetical protein
MDNPLMPESASAVCEDTGLLEEARAHRTMSFTESAVYKYCHCMLRRQLQGEPRRCRKRLAPYFSGRMVFTNRIGI